MATIGWRSGVALRDQLRRDFAHFDFYQLVRLLLRAGPAPRAGGAVPPPVGKGAGDPSDAAPGPAGLGVGREDADGIDGTLRFRADLSFAFPAHEVSALEPRGRDGEVELATPNYAVATAIGPLPEPFAELVADRASRGNRASADFLDIFNHRINALRFRIKARNHLSLSNQHPQDTPHAHYLAAIMGLGTEGLARQLPFQTRTLLGLAGVLANRRRSAPVIAAILARFLGAPVRIEQLRGAWQTVASDEWNRLGRANSVLGGTLALGRRAFDPHARIRLRIGPLPYERFCELLPAPRGAPAPGSPGARFLALLRYLTDRQMDVEVELLVDPATRPASELRAPDAAPPRTGSAYRGLRLAQTAWLGVRGDGASTGETPRARYLVPAFDGAHEGTT